jgi:hypothetical protein
MHEGLPRGRGRVKCPHFGKCTMTAMRGAVHIRDFGTRGAYIPAYYLPDG